MAAKLASLLARLKGELPDLTPEAEATLGEMEGAVQEYMSSETPTEEDDLSLDEAETPEPAPKETASPEAAPPDEEDEEDLLSAEDFEPEFFKPKKKPVPMK